jgi:hypothetical protein
MGEGLRKIRSPIQFVFGRIEIHERIPSFGSMLVGDFQLI